MSKTIKFLILGLSLAGAVLYDVLFNSHALGFNFALFMGFLIAAALVVRYVHDKAFKNAWSLLLLIPVVWFAGTVAVYENVFVGIVSPWAAVLLYVLFLFWSGVFDLSFVNITRLFPASLVTFVGRWVTHMGTPFAGLFQGNKKLAGKVVMGVLLSIPLLLVFAALFIGADQMFAEWVSEFFDVNLNPNTVWRVLRTFGLLFLFAGMWVVYLSTKRLNPEVLDEVKPIGEHHGVTEAVMLGVLNALFAIFIVAQMLFLFAGHEVVEKYGITYADYVHQGFYQMAFIAGLVVLVSYIVYRTNRSMKLNAAKIMNLIFIGQTLIITASALKRLFLYQEAYGLTQLRFLVWHFMIYVAVVLVSLAMVIIMKQHYRNFIKIGFVVSIAYLMFLTGVNMDAKIAKVNIDLFEAGKTKTLDVEYLSGLSLDAYGQAMRIQSLNNVETFPTNPWYYQPYVLDCAERNVDNKCEYLFRREYKQWFSWSLSLMQAKHDIPVFNSSLDLSR